MNYEDHKNGVMPWFSYDHLSLAMERWPRVKLHNLRKHSRQR